jgi:hypothetical protein
MSDATWLPNLVGGTSIWKLAVDLNEAKFFDGRLLVPETEGSESLPVTVRWDLTGLVPLKDARAAQPDAVAAAVTEFQACLERVAKVFSTPNSGFDKYKDAFTVPSLDSNEGANYFYSPEKKKLFVINWGASPRAMGGKAEYVFGYEDWAKSWGGAGIGAPSGAMPVAAVAGAAVAGAAAGAAGAAAVDAAKDKKKDEKKKDEKAYPWWVWPLFALIAIALVLLALFLLKACEEQKTNALADAGDGAAASADGAVDGASSADAAADAASSADASADAASADGGSDAGADAAGAGDGGADAGKDGGKDGGLAQEDDDDDDVVAGSSGGGSSGGGGKPVIVTVGPGGGQKTSVHRKHYQDEAVKWRVTQGANKVSRTEQAGHRYDVWLTPGQSFEGVRVEWQDKAGKWHPH